MAQVEKAPIVLKAGVKKEEAEELQKKLEAGATVSERGLVFDLRYCTMLCGLCLLRCVQENGLTSIACKCMQWGQRLRSNRKRIGECGRQMSGRQTRQQKCGASYMRFCRRVITSPLRMQIDWSTKGLVGS